MTVLFPLILTTVATLLLPAPAHAQQASGPIRVYVFTAADTSKPDDRAQKGRQDSVRDLDDLLRQGGNSLAQAETAESARLTLEVVSRAVEAVGESVTTDQIDAQGKHRMQSGRSVGGHKLVVRLSVPSAGYHALLTAADLSWRTSAKLVMKQVQDWVRANRVLLGPEKSNQL